MKKATILMAALIVLIPSLAYSDMLTVRLGYYMPQALNNLAAHPDSLWAIELSQMSMLKSDYRGSILGAGYEFFLTPQLSFAISVDFFSKENGGYYLDWVANPVNNVDYAFPAQSYYGSDILHTFHVSMTPVQFSLKLTPLGRKTRVIPYVGGGIGAYFVSASVWGSIVDFSQEYTYSDPDLGDVSVYPVVGADAHETRVVLGGHAFAGFMIPVGYRMTIEAEARYHYAKVNFREAFPAPEYDKFDLSGLSLSIGFNYWF
jgi:hypothetical protein